MAHYAVRESPPLRGEIPISTSKNAVLPIMCGALLTGEDVRIERVPELTDVKTLCALLASCGCSVKKEGDALVLNAGALQNPQDEEDVRKMRASVLVLGPLLSRLGEARIPLPGGCAIGQRPIDQHLKGMSALGAKVKFDHGGVTLSGGEPMCQPEACCTIADAAHAKHLNVWCYTGFTLDALLKENDPARMALLHGIDVLVDGRFVQEQKSLSLLYRGSSNQRLIDVPKTLATGEITLWTPPVW